MFSFFKSKISGPPSSPESERANGTNDFVVVDPSVGNPNPSFQGTPNMYPNFNQAFPYQPGNNPAANSSPTQPPPNTNNDSPQHTNYLHGVPFKLSPELSTGDSNEIMKIQVDDILAIITSKLEVSQNDYDFGLERSIIAEEEAASAAAAVAAEE